MISQKITAKLSYFALLFKNTCFPCRTVCSAVSLTMYSTKSTHGQVLSFSEIRRHLGYIRQRLPPFTSSHRRPHCYYFTVVSRSLCEGERGSTVFFFPKSHRRTHALLQAVWIPSDCTTTRWHSEKEEVTPILTIRALFQWKASLTWLLCNSARLISSNTVEEIN